MINDKDISTKINLIKMDRLEHARLKYYNEKVRYVKEQNYSLAAEMRDKERYFLLMIDRMKKMMKLNNKINK
jgi:hypothetical protein